jgi:hypothetical protein
MMIQREHLKRTKEEHPMAKAKKTETPKIIRQIAISARFPNGEAIVLDKLVDADKSSRSAVVRKAISEMAARKGIGA